MSGVRIADTVSCSNPRHVYELLRILKSVVNWDIECLLQNETGCAIATAYTALEVCAHLIDTCVLGIGKTNGFVPLDGLSTRMFVTATDYVISHYKLNKIRDIENLVAEAVEVNIPFNNPNIGFYAFTHKAGFHTKALLTNPSI